MADQPLISVIVPVYKVEKYLDRCIESIVNQTYRNLEIILVDDGSPDRSGEICDVWAARDSRIRVIHQANAGGGPARNAGIDVAKGDLIAFVDSDDYIAPYMYEYLYGILAQGADIAECGHVDAFDDNAAFDCGDFDMRAYTVQEAMAEHIRDRSFRQLIWNKLYRRRVVEDIRFPEGKGIDDEFFTYRVLGNAEKLIQSERVCYAYRQQPDSVMHTLDTKKHLRAVEARVQRHGYILEKFPALAGESVKSLWFTCLYQGQLILRSGEAGNKGDAIAYLVNVLNQHPMTPGNRTWKELVWLHLAGISFTGTCCLRNLLKIGL